MVQNLKRNGDDENDENNNVKPSTNPIKKETKENILSKTIEKEYTNFILKRFFEVLDGYKNLRGVIIIITTNYIHKFDKGLLRSGRIDYKIKLDYCDDEQITNIYDFYDLKQIQGKGNKMKNVSSADVIVKIFKEKYVLNSPKI